MGRGQGDFGGRHPHHGPHRHGGCLINILAVIGLIAGWRIFSNHHRNKVTWRNKVKLTWQKHNSNKSSIITL